MATGTNVRVQGAIGQRQSRLARIEAHRVLACRSSAWRQSSPSSGRDEGCGLQAARWLVDCGGALIDSA